MIDRARISATARVAIEAATASNAPVFVPTISLVEITYLAEKGKLPVELKSQLLARRPAEQPEEYAFWFEAGRRIRGCIIRACPWGVAGSRPPGHDGAAQPGRLDR